LSAHDGLCSTTSFLGVLCPMSIGLRRPSSIRS
jgi:hypothetical protein